MNFRPTRREAVRIDLTPLIDIIFQLVLFFMVSTTFIAAPGLEVDLPRSNSETVLQDQQDLSVWMSAEGEIFIDEVPVTWDGLVDTMRRAAERDPRTMVIIKADTKVGHGRVVAVMDTARSLGLSRLAIGTDAEGARQEAGSGSPEDPGDN